MKMIGLYALALCLVLVFATSAGTPPALAQTEETYVPHKMMWAAKRANVRAGPSTGNAKTDLLEVGERVTVVGKIGDWFKLRHRAGQPRRFVYAPLLTDVIPSTSRPSASQSTASASTVKTINYSNGDRYRGQIHRGKRNGSGVYTWAGGASYDGEWLNGDFHGYGVRTYANGNRYEGEWRSDMRNGHGVYTWANGDRYEGNYVDDRRVVRGTLTFADGNSYTQEWRDGKSYDANRPQSTCLSVKRTTVRYIGYWVNKCSAGIDVIWRDEGACRSRSGNLYPCSWFVGAGKEVTASIEGKVRWFECQSPGGLGDVMAMERDGTLYCWTSAASQTVAHKNQLRSTAHRLAKQAEVREDAEWARQQREWEREEAEWETQMQRNKAASWNRIINSFGDTLDMLQMLKKEDTEDRSNGGDYSSSRSNCVKTSRWHTCSTN